MNMYKEINTQPWNQYLETNHRGGQAMKLDRILRRRMRAFMKVRQSKLEFYSLIYDGEV